MKRGIFLTLFTFVFATVHANTYYFSSNAGDDSRTASQAQDPATPWRTISKLNSFFSNLVPGDAVLFNRGETFYGSIEILKSRELYAHGVSNSTLPITIGAYGSGAKPIITGLSTITNWIDIGGGIYESNLGQDHLNLVTFQDTLQPIGRWPRVSEKGAGYLEFQSHYGATSITSNSINSAKNFTGGEVVIRKGSGLLDRGIISNQTSSTVYYSTLTAPNHPSYSYEPQDDGLGFFFQNHVNTFAETGDWMYEAPSKKLKMYFSSNNPAAYAVKASTVEKLINITSSTYITIDNLSLQGGNSNAISMDYAYHIQITNCDINFSGIDAITTNKMGDCSDITVKNCSITNSNNNAITANVTQSWTIQNNIIKNTGMIRGMGLSGDGQYNALSYPGSNSVIENNEIRNTGYNGIDFKGSNVSIKNNFIEAFCTVKSDGGGIYTYAETGKKGRKVIGNIVLNGIGDLNGRKEEARNSPYAGNVHGIYLDNGASDVEITDNTVANCSSSGLELSGAQNIKVINNTFFNNTQSQVYYWESVSPIYNLIFTNNILFATKRDQLISLIVGSLNNIPNWGTLDYNYYSRPISEPDNVDSWGYSNWPKSKDDFNDGGIIQGPNGKFYSLNKWKEAVRQDLNSSKSSMQISDLSQIRFEYNATNSSKTISLNTSYVDVKGNAYSNSITLAPYSSVILLKSEIGGNSQSINFTSISNKTYGDAPFILNATASSGLPVSFKILSGPATLSGNTVTATGTGAIVVEASQEGNASYSPAPHVTQSFNVVLIQNCKPTFLNNALTVLDATCSHNDGKISILPTSGVPPFKYSLDGGVHYSVGADAGHTFVDLWPGTFRLRLKDANGCESDVVEATVRIMYGKDCAETSSAASASASVVSDVPLLSAGVEVIKTFPNPSKGQFTVQLTNFPIGKVEVAIVDGKGATIKNSQINVTANNNTLDFNLSAQGSGVYYIKITSKTGTKTSKVIIQ